MGRSDRGGPRRRRCVDSAGQKHWHGATATTSMTHIAIQEFLEGKNVDWMEKVSDEQYGR
jgi:hypothetical protein